MTLFETFSQHQSAVFFNGQPSFEQKPLVQPHFAQPIIEYHHAGPNLYPSGINLAELHTLITNIGNLPLPTLAAAGATAILIGALTGVEVVRHHVKGAKKTKPFFK